MHDFSRTINQVNVAGSYRESILGTNLSDSVLLQAFGLRVAKMGSFSTKVETSGAEDRILGIYTGHVDGRLGISVDSGPETDFVFIVVIFSGTGQVVAEADEHTGVDRPVVIPLYGMPTPPPQGSQDPVPRGEVASLIGDAEALMARGEVPDSLLTQLRTKLARLRATLRDLA
jgi:hypothetical protein